MQLQQTLKKIGKRIFIDGLSGMALGLFATLIVGLILKQIGSFIGTDSITWLNTISKSIIWFGTLATVMTGVGIGVGTAYKLKAAPLVVYSAAVTGFIGAYASKLIAGSMITSDGILLIGPGEPLGAFIGSIIGIEVGRLVSGKTKLDIIVTPITTIISGGMIGIIVGPPISAFMGWLGNIIVVATEQAPFIMGMLVSTLMGMILTLPISSAALSIILGLNGLASGAATVGCSTQMIGFAVASYRENKVNGLLAQGLGTSMLQVPNIVKNPRIWLPPTIASAILGPLSTIVFKMENNAAGGGMGTSGLVGQIMTWQTMIDYTPKFILLLKILGLHFILPAILTLIISEFMRKINWIKDGDMKLNL